MTHELRLARELRQLLQRQRVAALGTLDDAGNPFVSMVPFAIEAADGLLVLHVSALAAHTAHLAARPRVSLLVMQAEAPGEPVHELPRATLLGECSFPPPQESLWQACRAAYLQRFPEAEPMTQLADFRFAAIAPREARHIAGFGRARSVDVEALREALRGGAD